MTQKPSGLVLPGPGQESVWDYPRPPAVRPDERLVTVALAGEEIARSKETIRILETSPPPTFISPRVTCAPGTWSYPGASHSASSRGRQYTLTSGLGIGILKTLFGVTRTLPRDMKPSPAFSPFIPTRWMNARWAARKWNPSPGGFMAAGSHWM